MALARKYQMGGLIQPLSLLDINTPKDTSVSEEDTILRGRVLHLGQIITEEKSTADAIKGIVGTLRT